MTVEKLFSVEILIKKSVELTKGKTYLVWSLVFHWVALMGNSMEPNLVPYSELTMKRT